LAEEYYFEEKPKKNRNRTTILQEVAGDTIAVCIMKKDSMEVTCDIYKGGKLYVSEKTTKDKLREVLRKYGIE